MISENKPYKPLRQYQTNFWQGHQTNGKAYVLTVNNAMMLAL